jgi:hypothetical protein
MLFDLDRYVLKNKNRVFSIIIGYEDNTKAYGITPRTGKFNDHYAKLKTLPDLPVWQRAYQSYCCFKFINCVKEIVYIDNLRVICRECYNYYHNSRQIRQFDTYIRPYIGEYNSNNGVKEPALLNAFYNGDKYYVITQNDQLYTITTIQTKSPAFEREHQECRRRKYIRRLLMFARVNLIRDVIMIIAQMVADKC